MMIDITNFSYEQVPADTVPAIAQMLETKGILMYRIEFTYEHTNGIMLTYISSNLVEDIHFNLGKHFADEVKAWIEENPPYRT